MTDLVDRINALARIAGDAGEKSFVSQVEPLRKPEGGFVDIRFDSNSYLIDMVDARGNLIEIGRRISTDDGFIIRIPWPVLGDPQTQLRGRSRHRQTTEDSAAAMQLPKSGTKRAAVLSAFISDRRNGGDGLIDEDVASLLQMNLYTAAPRRTELVNMGWLRPSGRVGRTRMDSESIKWELTPAAIERLGLS